MSGLKKPVRLLLQTGLTLFTLLSMALVAFVPTGSAAPNAAPPYGNKTLIFVSDGMRPDLVEKWSASGDLPNYAKIVNGGVTGANGMIPQFPPNTGAGWSSIATGALASVHGGVNNTFHIDSNAIVTSTTGFAATTVQAETIAEVAEKYGKKVAVMEYTGVLPGTTLKGPVVDYRNFYSGRGVIANYDVPGANAGFVKDFGLQYVNNTQISNAEGWTGAPTSYSPAKETSFSFQTYAVAGVVATMTWQIYIYDSTNDGATNYDTAFVARGDKIASQAVANLKAGDWKDIKTSLPQNNLLVGFYMKLIDLSPDLSKFRLYYTSISRARSNMADLEQKIALEYPSATGSDYAPLEAGIIDADTYVEQGLRWYDLYKNVYQYVIQTYTPDLVLAGYPITDEFSHMFLGLTTPGSPSYNAATAAKYEGYIKQSYKQADTILGNLQGLLGQNTVSFVASDHGFAAAWKSVNAPLVLQNAGLYDPANRAGSKAGIYIAGATANVYVNLTGREQGGVVAAADYEAVRTQIMAAFNGLSDNGTKVAAAVWKKEELFNLKVDGFDWNSYHPTRTGDVVVVLNPPYQFDAPTAGAVVADSSFYGQHGYLPDAVDLSKNVNMHSMFGISGPGIASGKKITSPRVIDIAPTAAYVMNIPVPRYAQGRVLTEAFSDNSPSLVPIQILSWSDYHCQLDPVTDTVDRLSVPTGGVALIQEYWKRDIAENPNGTIILSSGDDTGATPPSCAFLDNKPSIDAMNAMNFDAASLGNHEFDKGVDGFRALEAQSKFTWLADNIIDQATGKLADFATPYVIETRNGIDVGIIGVANQDTPSVTSPKGIAGYSWIDPVDPTNAYVKELVGKGVKTIIVLYHQGSTSTDMDKPTGPIVDLAMKLDPEVDLITSGHNRRLTMARVNGILVNEGNQALQTNRFQLLVDPTTKNVVYSYGVFQKPWGGSGITGDATLAAIAKNAADTIKPILGGQVGVSAELVDRSRGGESKMGNLITDGIRATYQVDVALQNSGGLRADFQPGPLTRADVFAVLPFGNLTVVGDLKGSDLLAALENGVSDVSGTAGRFPQVSGIRFAYDAAKPVGSRILWAVLSDGKALDPNKTYRVGTNDFMVAGGDGYTALTKMQNPVSQAQLYEIAVTYVQTLGTVNPQLEGRIVAAQAGQPAPTPPAQATPALPTPQPLSTAPAGAATAAPSTATTAPAAPTTTAAPAVPTSTTAPAVPTSTTAPAVPTNTSVAVAPTNTSVAVAPTAGPTEVTPGMPRTGAGDNTGFWITLVVIAVFFTALGLWMNLRRKSNTEA